MTETTATRAPSHDEEHGGIAYYLDSPVLTGQLDEEIVAAMGWRKSAEIDVVDGRTTPEGFIGPLPQSEKAEGEDLPRTLLVVKHENGDATVIGATIRAHVPDPSWITPGPRMDDLVDKAKRGEALDPIEVATAMAQILKER